MPCVICVYVQPCSQKKVALAAFPRGYYASYYGALGIRGESWSC